MTADVIDSCQDPRDEREDSYKLGDQRREIVGAPGDFVVGPVTSA
jgi:hypothetical protein